MATDRALSLEVSGVGLSWGREALRALGEADATPAPPWELAGEIDSSAVGLLRVVSASFEDGSLLGVLAARPPEAWTHGDEAIGAVLVVPEAEGGEELETVSEVLLSTQYGPSDAPTRLGLELWMEGEGPPARIAADATGGPRASGGPLPGEGVPMSFRFEGVAGTGLYELLRPPS